MAPWAIQFMQTTWAIVLESAVWILASLFFAGLIHEFMPSSGLKKHLNRNGVSAMGGAVALGGVLPICSCGVIPISVSLYRAGVRIGPVMAFTAATPIINPAAVILSFALLGPQITFAYVLLGLLLPFFLGVMSERFGDKRAASPPEPATTSSCCSEDACQSIEEKLPFHKRIASGLRWGFLSLGPTIGFYLGIGILLAGVLSVAIPPEWSERYLSADSVFGLLAAALLGASIYVCAVAHIPLVATLLAAGAGPGAAIVFLVTGTATNLPELFALYKTIGKRTVIIYTTSLIVASLVAGVCVNLWLGADFSPVFDPLASLDLIETGEKLWLSPGALIKTLAACLTIALAAWGFWLHFRQRFLARRTSDSSTCCGSD
jgi:uncharacterized membrane protein YraQ (UPF0718 family)